MRISDWEGRPDFKRIVESVPCPFVAMDRYGNPVGSCGAPVGMPRRNISATPGTLSASMARTDWHNDRKYNGIHAFLEAQNEAVNGKVLTPVVQGENIAVDSGTGDGK
jgi:hypothetical protein